VPAHALGAERRAWRDERLGHPVSVLAELFRVADAGFRRSGSIEPMTLVTVRYFAAAADAAGREEERLELGEATVGALRELLAERYGEPMQRVLRNGSFLVDGTVRRDPATPIGAAVDLLPPFAGG